MDMFKLIEQFKSFDFAKFEAMFTGFLEKVKDYINYDNARMARIEKKLDILLEFHNLHQQQEPVIGAIENGQREPDTNQKPN